MNIALKEQMNSSSIRLMKFSCHTPDLLSGLQLVSRAIGSDQTLPILQNILLTVEKNTCTLSATNLELSIITSMMVNIESEGSITVPAKAILNFVQYNQDDTIVLEVSEGTQLKVSSRRAKAVISGEAASAFPVITSVPKQTSLSVPADPLLKALSLVTFACAKTTSRPVISGVYAHIDGETLTLVGTDSYRLSEYKLPLGPGDQKISCIIPAKFLEELRVVIAARKGEGGTKDKEGKKVKSEKEDLEINLSQQQIEVRVGPVQLTSRLIDGKFPDYVQVLPKTKSTSVFLTTKELLNAVKRMHYFAKEVNNNITFTVKDGAMHLSTKQTQIGRDESEITVRVEGEDNKIAISSHYIIDFLARLDVEELMMELSDKMHPAVFKIPGSNEFLHLIMPLRMAEE